MTPVAPETVQALVDKILEVQAAITTAGDVGRTKMQDLGVDAILGAVPTAADGKVDDTAWKGKPPKEQEELKHRLIQLRDSLFAAAGQDGPSDPRHIMHSVHASNGHIVCLGIVVAGAIGLLLYLVILNWGEATGTALPQSVTAALQDMAEIEALEAGVGQAKQTLLERQEAATSLGGDATGQQQADAALAEARDQVETSEAALTVAREKLKESAVKILREIRKGGATEESVLVMVVLLGALGGSLHFVGSLVKFVGNRQLMRSWLMWYLSMPIAGALLALIVYMLLRVGLLSPTSNGGDGSTISNLNVIAIYAFAALTGLFSKTAVEKLGEVFQTLFRTGEASRDPLSSNGKPGES